MYKILIEVKNSASNKFPIAELVVKQFCYYVSKLLSYNLNVIELRININISYMKTVTAL